MEQLVNALLTHYPYVGGVIVVLWAIYKISKPVYRWIRKLVMVMNNYDTIVKDLSVIVKELKPNGGSSIKDSVNRIEFTLHEQNEKYRIMMAMNETPLFETDKMGRCTYVNRWYSDLTGLSYEECMGYGWLNAIDSKDRGRVNEEWGKAVTQGREYISAHTIIHKEESIPVKCKAFPVKDRKGEIISYQGKLNYEQR